MRIIQHVNTNLNFSICVSFLFTLTCSKSLLEYYLAHCSKQLNTDNRHHRHHRHLPHYHHCSQQLNLVYDSGCYHTRHHFKQLAGRHHILAIILNN